MSEFLYMIASGEKSNTVVKFDNKIKAEKWKKTHPEYDTYQIVNRDKALELVGENVVAIADYIFTESYDKVEEIKSVVLSAVQVADENKNEAGIVGDNQNVNTNIVVYLMLSGLRTGLRNGNIIFLDREEYEEEYGVSTADMMYNIGLLYQCEGYIGVDAYNVIDTCTIRKDYIIVESPYLHRLLYHIVDNVVHTETAFVDISAALEEIISDNMDA